MKTLRTLVITGALAAAALAALSGCSEKPTNEAPVTTQSDTATDNATDTATDTATLAAFRNDAGELVCPVQGDVIPDPEKSAGFQDYKEMRYYFCCAGCPEAFAADPEKYINK
jgi:YHS domain-containing protein